MAWSKWSHWSISGALLAAVAWTVSGIFALIFPGSNMGDVGTLSWRLIESSDAIAEAGMLAALVGFHTVQRPRYGRSGTVGFAVAFLGTAFLLLSTIIWLLMAGTEGVFLGLLFSSGTLGVLLGFPILGVATFKTRALPSWCGLLLIGWLVYFPLIFYLVDFYGEARALLGPVWLALGYALWSERDTSGVRHNATATI